MKTKKRMIKGGITVFYRQKMDSKQPLFRGWEITDFIMKKGGLIVYPDTVLRYMREMRNRGVINYDQIGRRSESLYEFVRL